MLNNMIESKTLIPNIMKQSRDYQAMCKILDLIINNVKFITDDWVNLINIDRCPDKMLPLLATYCIPDTQGIYDYSETPEVNRLIIKHWKDMMYNRGSVIGMSMSVALSVNSVGVGEEVESLAMFHIVYKSDEKEAVIYIYYPDAMVKSRDLLYWTRPAGIGLRIVPASLISTLDGIAIHSYLQSVRYYYTSDRYSIDQHGKIGFSEIENFETINNNPYKDIHVDNINPTDPTYPIPPEFNEIKDVQFP